MVEANFYIPGHQQALRSLGERLATSSYTDNGRDQFLLTKASTSLTDCSGSTQPQALKRVMAEANSYIPRYQRALSITWGALGYKLSSGQ